MFFFYFIALVIVITFQIYSFIKKRYSYWRNLGFLQLEPHFPYGSLKGVGSEFNAKDLIVNTYEKFKGKSSIVGLYFFINPIAFILDLDLIKNILIKDFSNFTDRGSYINEKDDPVSAHLFNLEGTKWKNLRSKLSSTFTSGKMKFMFSTVLQTANELEKCLNEQMKIDSVIEIKDLMARYTTDVIGTCAFGIECNSLKDPNAEFRNIGRKLVTPPTQFIVLLRFFHQTFPSLARKLRMRNMSDEMQKFFIGIVKETIDYREKNKIRRNDFMDILIELKNNAADGNNLTVTEIAAQAFLFFFAGFETSSTNMTFTLYELAKNQEIQDKLRLEILNVLKKYNNELTYEGMIEMKYLDQVINEALRKYPALANLRRKTLNEYKVPNSNLILEKGIEVLIPVYPIHHDHSIYPNPSVFDPERFSAASSQERNPITFLSFGEGPRNCIGLRFGKMQSRIGIITLLKHFKFSLYSTEEIEFSKTLTILSPDKEIKLRIEKI